MLRFFRQIRQRLLTDNPPDQTRRAGKFSKYLLYAVGEILLVVIGILIALQIDNWNENRKKASAEWKLLIQIEQDLVEGREIMALFMDWNKEFLTSGRYVKEHLYSNSPLTDSLLFHLQRTKRQIDFNIVDTGYQAMLNSGSTEFINDSLRAFLSKYFEYTLDLVKVRNDKLLAIQWNHLDPFMLTHFKEERIESEESEYYNQFVTVPRDYMALTHNDTYANILQLKIHRLELNILRLAQTQEILERLIKEVQTEIDRLKELL